MAQALLKTWTGEKKIPLEQALKPSGYSDAGTLEKLESHIEMESEAIGKLLALLVERKVVDISEACLIAGQKNPVALYTWQD